MKKQLVTLSAVALLVITGCQAGDDEQGQQGTQNNNVEPVRFKNNDADELNHTHNYTMQRDIEEKRTTPNNLGTQNINNNQNQRNTNRYDVADEAAELIARKIDGIDNAYVLTTDNNAYVAAELDTHKNGNNLNHYNEEQLTDEVKEQIATIVKSVDNNIDNVYVSTNPDFMDLTNDYINDVDNGEPVEGLFEQMGTMIERVFPENPNH
ncbi:YhcN/YlaJ family sporulation lipoprotein [Ornithinibacillus contaminans]|uniref:YhcN/YlaJ family sporulation lipoprotein n=1 Tax=Ornithinibacillus contaminans TaxID=694055 RepID=UPI00064D77C9|nr:YhcN/YlaJ family sporulation lipoprotein [Ornithinibacillus contaminans]